MYTYVYALNDILIDPPRCAYRFFILFLLIRNIFEHGPGVCTIMISFSRMELHYGPAAVGARD